MGSNMKSRNGNETKLYVSQVIGGSVTAYDWKEVKGMKSVTSPQQTIGVVQMEELSQSGVPEAEYGCPEPGELTAEINTKFGDENEGLTAIQAAKIGRLPLAVKVEFKKGDGYIISTGLVLACEPSPAQKNTELFNQFKYRPNVEIEPIATTP